MEDLSINTLLWDANNRYLSVYPYKLLPLI